MEMALDIQDLLEGRELWSKAKQPASLNGGMAPIPNEKDKSSTSQRGTAVRLRSTQRVKRSPIRAGRIFHKRVTKYFAGALFGVGLLLFGLRVGQGVWHKGPPAQNGTAKSMAAPLPLLGEEAAVKTAPDLPPALSGTNVPSAPPSELVAKMTRKSPPKSPTQPVHSSAAIASAGPAATLDIEVDHKFAEAHLSIWVDGTLSYTRTLEGTDKKHFVVFHHVQGHEIHAMQITPGKHRFRVQVTSGTNSSDQIVTGDFASGNEKLLRISFDKRGEMDLNLE
jgi:hypothetical protein